MEILFSLILILFMGTFAYAGLKAAPWFPTWQRDVERFLKLAEFKPGQKFYDLGCGDGRLVAEAARAEAKATGFEISILPYLLAKVRSLFIKNMDIKFKDFWKADLSDADVVYLFLTPGVNPKARTKFSSELKKGAKVIAYTWPIDGWEPLKIDVEKNRPTIYLYTIA